MMKKLIIKLLFISFLIHVHYSCNDTKIEPTVPIPPILKEIEMPNETDVMPGQITQIQGLGFSREDRMYLSNTKGTTEVEVVEATDSYIKFSVPKDAGGEYSVIIERAGKQTTLNNKLKVPFVVPLSDVELPKIPISQKGEINIIAKGFEAGDIAKLTATFYPENVKFNIPVTLTSEGAKFKLPEGVYGVNTLIIIRGNRKKSLGTVIAETNVGDELGGGIVFWVDANKTHGYIASKVNAGTATEQFGPEVTPADAAETSRTLGSGKSNTQKIISKMIQLMTLHNWTEWKNVKIAAELCKNFLVTENNVTYTDWFLPSQEELIELFKVKKMMSVKGYSIPANNYWTSSEAEGNEGWAAYYVNFYEETNIVSGPASKSGWKIGVRPIRSY